MRSFILALGFCLIAGLVYGDVTGEIIAKDIDNNGNIRVWTQYKIDGVEVKSRYPKIGGKYVWATRYHALSFAGMTDAQIKTRIVKDVIDHTETLIINTYRKIANDDIIANHLGTVISSKTITKDVTREIDIDGDGVNDKEITFKTDGTSVVSSISP